MNRHSSIVVKNCQKMSPYLNYLNVFLNFITSLLIIVFMYLLEDLYLPDLPFKICLYTTQRSYTCLIRKKLRKKYLHLPKDCYHLKYVNDFKKYKQLWRLLEIRSSSFHGFQLHQLYFPVTNQRLEEFCLKKIELITFFRADDA